MAASMRAFGGVNRGASLRVKLLNSVRKRPLFPLPTIKALMEKGKLEYFLNKVN